ncbi:MAG: hypothetical protein ABJA64_00625, partial [Candidatus Saccharibacteria bacterium]
DITAPCLPEKLLGERADWLRLARWPGAEALGLIALGLEIAKEKALKRHMGTVALNPNFLISNFVGVGPALFSGEAGRFASWVPENAAMYISTFKNDTVSRPDVWRKLYQNHPNVYIREHKHGTHMTLANDKVINSKTTRTNAIVDLRTINGDDMDPNDLQNIYEMHRRPRIVYPDAA